MPKSLFLFINLSDHQVCWGNCRLALSKRFYQLYCRLAVARLKSVAVDKGFVDLEEIARLPLWGKNTLMSVGKQINRHIAKMRNAGIALIEGQQKVKGPFRLGVLPAQIRLDMPIEKL